MSSTLLKALIHKWVRMRQQMTHPYFKLKINYLNSYVLHFINIRSQAISRAIVVQKRLPLLLLYMID